MSKGEQALSTSLPENPDGFRIALDTSGEHADIERDQKRVGPWSEGERGRKGGRHHR